MVRKVCKSPIFKPIRIIRPRLGFQRETKGFCWETDCVRQEIWCKPPARPTFWEKGIVPTRLGPGRAEQRMTDSEVIFIEGQIRSGAPEVNTVGPRPQFLRLRGRDWEVRLNSVRPPPAKPGMPPPPSQRHPPVAPGLPAPNQKAAWLGGGAAPQPGAGEKFPRPGRNGRR